MSALRASSPYPHPSLPDKALRGFLSAVYAALHAQIPPQPLFRSIAVPEGQAAGPCKIDWKNSPIPSSLALLAGDLPSLPPSLDGGLPAIRVGSSPDDIAKANAAASNAFDFVIEGLKQHGVEKLNFNVDPKHAEGIPSQAYFVLHHGYTNKITPNTTDITVMYAKWLQSAGFAQ